MDQETVEALQDGIAGGKSWQGDGLRLGRTTTGKREKMKGQLPDCANDQQHLRCI